MPTTKPYRDRLQALKARYDELRRGKESLLRIINESELSESVYNSNAIENSTLTLRDTEKILLELEVSRDLNVREVFEAKNLGRVMEYMETKAPAQELTSEMVLLLHRMLMTSIHDEFAGRFRKKGEYVRVGGHIAPAPERVEKMMEEILIAYSSDQETYFVDAIARFHLAFETLHPFNDGNGRIGRVLMNYQLIRKGFPVIIVRNKEKKTYYSSFDEYHRQKSVKTMAHIIALALMESLHKRIAYMTGEPIVPLTAFAKDHGIAATAFLNAAKRQTIPAFREKGAWHIGGSYDPSIA